MARGWESKSVEGQIEALEAGRHHSRRAPLAREEADRLRLKESLMLSRKRVVRELEETRIPRRRAILEASLAHLDARLAELG